MTRASSKHQQCKAETGIVNMYPKEKLSLRRENLLPVWIFAPQRLRTRFCVTASCHTSSLTVPDGITAPPTPPHLRIHKTGPPQLRCRVSQPQPNLNIEPHLTSRRHGATRTIDLHSLNISARASFHDTSLTFCLPAPVSCVAQPAAELPRLITHNPISSVIHAPSCLSPPLSNTFPARPGPSAHPSIAYSEATVTARIALKRRLGQVLLTTVPQWHPGTNPMLVALEKPCSWIGMSQLHLRPWPIHPRAAQHMQPVTQV